MRIIGSQRRETLAEAGYTVIETVAPWSDGTPSELILQDDATGNIEAWGLNDSHAGYTLDYNGNGYEFLRSIR